MKYSKQDIEDKPFDFVYVDDFGINKKLESANAPRPTIDQLSDNVLESLTGVTSDWLSPVRPHFEKLAAMAMSKNVSDGDFIDALKKSQREMPELFDKLNVEALQTSLEDAIGTAMLSGSVERYESGEVKAYNPNQKRASKGEANGGQWVSEDGGGDLGYDVFTPPKPQVIKLVGNSGAETWEKEAANKAVSEINNLGFTNPMNPSEVVIDGAVKVDVRQKGADIWLKSIESIKQGKGKGTGVLNEIKTIATENGVDIWLNPEPIGNTSREKLIQWYESNGFINDGGGKWRFTPSNKLESSNVKAYNPNQKRGEAGTPQGGRWVKEDGAKSQKEKTIERFGDEASSMMRKLKENEGFTLNLDGTDELSGYAVSIDKSSERVFDELTEDNLEDYIRDFWDDLNLEGRHLGGWYNKADNKIYLDVPIIVDDFDTATRLASENDQIAFFHLDTFTEYQTDEAIRQIEKK